jgi:hypothetical protein
MMPAMSLAARAGTEGHLATADDARSPAPAGGGPAIASVDPHVRRLDAADDAPGHLRDHRLPAFIRNGRPRELAQASGVKYRFCDLDVIGSDHMTSTFALTGDTDCKLALAIAIWLPSAFNDAALDAVRAQDTGGTG